MNANVTLKLDTDLIREARILAAEEGTSISTQVLQGLSVSARKRAANPLDLRATRELVSDYLRGAWS